MTTPQAQSHRVRYTSGKNAAGLPVYGWTCSCGHDGSEWFTEWQRASAVRRHRGDADDD